MKIRNLKTSNSHFVKNIKTGAKLVLNLAAHAALAVGVVSLTVNHLTVLSVLLAPFALVAIGSSYARFSNKIAASAKDDGTFLGNFINGKGVKDAIKTKYENAKNKVLSLKRKRDSKVAAPIARPAVKVA